MKFSRTLLSATFLCLLFTTNSFARSSCNYPSPDLTWDEIKTCSNLMPSFPSIPMVGSLITIDELCAMGNNLALKQHIRERCVRNGSGDSGECEAFEKVHYMTSRNYYVDKCTEFSHASDALICTKKVRLQMKYPLDYMVTVNELTSAGDGWTLTPLFTKSFQIPSCQ